jgi:hypothetical protein
MLFLGLLAIPVVMFYMLRLRRKEIVVSSTMLWNKFMRDLQANTPWQRLRRNLLLFLQLLILAFLVFALARPFLPVPSITHGNAVVLLDGSASMLATDQSPNRFAVAKSEVERLITELDGHDQMTIIQVGRTPQVLVSASNDKSLLRKVISDAQPGLEVANWPAALALAAGASQGFQDARIIIVSDGGLTENLPPISAEIVYVKVGEKAENLAISALTSRSTADGEQVFVSVTNFGPQETETILSLKLDGRLFDSLRVRVLGNSTVNLTKDLPGDSSIIEAHLSENDRDFLLHDDRAWTVPQQDEDLRILIVGAGNHFLETAYSVLPNVQVFLARPDQSLLAEQTDEFDIIVFDRVPLPEELPQANLLLIDPAMPIGEEERVTRLPLIVDGYFENTNVVRLSDNPLLQFVDWGNVNVRRARLLEAPWARTLVAGEGGPLLLSGQHEGRRTVILTFALQESDLPLQIAFPVLIANITDWLSPGQPIETAESLLPGEPIFLRPGLTASAAAVIKPDGEIWTTEIGAEPTIFAETGELGVYEVRYRDNSGESSAGHFAVNMSESIESDIGPKESLKIGQIEVTNAGRNDTGQQELWPWFLATTLVILMLEWWIYHRGSRLPEISNWRPFINRFRSR